MKQILKSKILFVLLLMGICLPVMAQKLKVSGTVYSETKETLPGVYVIVKGTSNGVSTDLDGKYTIDVDGEAALLEYSFIGYTKHTEVVGTRTLINVALQPESSRLDEVIVLGYGAQSRKSDLSASIGTIENLEAVKGRAITNGAEMLQGQIPGVTVMSDGGDPTAGASIVIRGSGSKSGEEPLWVVDGVPGAPVNINDIENMVVLKDAASAAIYGAYSGSSGVILVTTKKAKQGIPTVSYEGTFGTTTATRLLQSLTIEDERQIRAQAYLNDGATLNDIGWDPAKNPYIATTRTDWMDAIFRTALFQRHNVSLNAGTESFANRVSVQYNDNQGTLINTYSKSLNLRYEGWFKIGKYVRVREDLFWENKQERGADTQSGYTGAILSALMMPRSSEVRYADGTYGGTAPKDPAYVDQYGNNFAGIHGDVVNPVRSLEADSRYHRPSNLVSSTFFEILEPIKGLKFTSRFTYRLENYMFKRFSPARPEPGKPNLTSSLEYQSSRTDRWDAEQTLNYDRTFNKHTIGALVSTTANQNRKRYFQASAQGFENEAEMYQYFQFAQKYETPKSEYQDPDNNVSVIGRLAYSWNNKYFITGSLRRDYAGRLPEGKKYGDFPAITGGWKISEEAFIPKNDIVTLIKLRASWGRIGNLGSISNAYGNPTLESFGSNDVGGQVGINTPTVPSMVYKKNAFNRNLTWETSEQTDLGLDMKFLSNKLTVSADYFKKRTYNLIRQQTVGWPSYIGLEAPFINEGEITNTGFEFSVGWNDQVGEFKYFVNANLSTLKNKVSDIGSVNPLTGNKTPWTDGPTFRGTLSPYRTIEGGPLYEYWLVKSDGLFQTDEQAAAYVDKEGNRIQPNAKAGDLKFIDQDGDGKITDDDRLQMDAYFPKVTYAFTTGFTYKNLSVSMMLQGVGGIKAFHAAKFLTLNESQGSFNRWDKIKEAGSGDVPRLSYKDPNANFSTQSDWYLEDASYLRIKNINITYSLSSLLHKVASAFDERKSSLTVNLSVDNLYTFTKYTGMDPEVGNSGMDALKYPVPRIVSFGIKLTY